MSDLMIVESVNPVEVFTEKGLDPLLNKIAEEARSFVPDVTTDKGRKEIASMAYKVARSKTFLDDKGKQLVAEQKAAIKLVDDERKRMRDYLDALKDEVRAPLTAYEDAEKARLEMIQSRVHWFDIKTAEAENAPSSVIKDLIAGVESTEITETFFAEMVTRAAVKKDATLVRMRETLKATEQREAEQAELERLRREAAEREQKDREERIAREAEAKAKAEAEAQLRAAEEAAKQAEEAKRQADERAKLAEQQAKEQAERAAKQERDRIEAEQRAEAEAQAKREANKAHKAKVNRAIVDALIAESGITEEQAKTIVIAVAKNKIANLTIAY
jgi:hypothetical protein